MWVWLLGDDMCIYGGYQERCTMAHTRSIWVRYEVGSGSYQVGVRKVHGWCKVGWGRCKVGLGLV